VKATLKIQNLKCSGCAKTIISRLSGLKNIADVSVNHKDGAVSLIYLNDNTLSEAKKLLKKIGYPVVGEKNNLTTKAKSYISCSIGRVT
jgi:copper chaperone